MTDHEKWIEKRYNDALEQAEDAVIQATARGMSIEGATARAENLALDCVNMDRAAPKIEDDD